MEKQTLVAFYSRTGTTKKIALEMADSLHSDIEEIIDKKNRNGIIGYLGAGRDAALKKLALIQDIQFNPKEYKTLIIGTPVRDFTMSASIRTYLTNNRDSFPENIYFFCTQASSGDMATFHEMADLCGKKPVHTVSFTSREVKLNSYKFKLGNFLNKLKQ